MEKTVFQTPLYYLLTHYAIYIEKINFLSGSSYGKTIFQSPLTIYWQTLHRENYVLNEILILDTQL